MPAAEGFGANENNKGLFWPRCNGLGFEDFIIGESDGEIALNELFFRVLGLLVVCWVIQTPTASGKEMIEAKELDQQSKLAIRNQEELQRLERLGDKVARNSKDPKVREKYAQMSRRSIELNPKYEDVYFVIHDDYIEQVSIEKIDQPVVDADAELQMLLVELAELRKSQNHRVASAIKLEYRKIDPIDPLVFSDEELGDMLANAQRHTYGSVESDMAIAELAKSLVKENKRRIREMEKDDKKRARLEEYREVMNGLASPQESSIEKAN